MKPNKMKPNKFEEMFQLDTGDWHATNELERVSVDLQELREKYTKLVAYLGQILPNYEGNDDRPWKDLKDRLV
jgi:hypothetical protein